MPDSTLALADFAAKLAIHYCQTGNDPYSFSPTDVLEMCRLAHKQYGVNDDTERDANLFVLQMLAVDLRCDLDLDNKALVPQEEGADPLPIPRLDEPAAPALYRTMHIVAYPGQLRPVVDGYHFDHAELDNAKRLALFESILAGAYDEARVLGEARHEGYIHCPWEDDDFLAALKARGITPAANDIGIGIHAVDRKGRTGQR